MPPTEAITEHPTAAEDDALIEAGPPETVPADDESHLIRGYD